MKEVNGEANGIDRSFQCQEPNRQTATQIDKVLFCFFKKIYKKQPPPHIFKLYEHL